METTPKTAPARRRLGLSGSLGRHLLTPLSTSKTPVTKNSENIINTEDTSITRKTDENNANSGNSKTSIKGAPYANIANSGNSKTSTPHVKITNSGNSKNSVKPNETPVSSKPKNQAYKLSLCKVTSETMTKKRTLCLKSTSLIQPKRLKLEDVPVEESDESNSNQQVNCDTKLSDGCDGTSEQSLRTEIDELKKTIATIEKYDQRVPELLRLIKKWQDAGRKTIEELKEKIEPKQDIEVILAHFQIDPGLFYVEIPE